MRPSSLRRFGMAAVAGSLLMTCGAIPTFGESGSNGNDVADLGRGDDLDRACQESAGVASPLDAALDAGRALWRKMIQADKVFIWLTPADPRTPIAPATTIVDDGAPF